jgi:hypothetical protein
MAPTNSYDPAGNNYINDRTSPYINKNEIMLDSIVSGGVVSRGDISYWANDKNPRDSMLIPVLNKSDSLWDSTGYFPNGNNACLKVIYCLNKYDNSFCGVTIQLFSNPLPQNISVIGMKYLSFWIKSDYANANMEIALGGKLKTENPDSDETRPKRLLWYNLLPKESYMKGGDFIPTPCWKKVYLPLSDLQYSISGIDTNLIDLSALKYLTLSFSRAAPHNFIDNGSNLQANIYISDIAFETDSIPPIMPQVDTITYIPKPDTGFVFIKVTPKSSPNIFVSAIWGTWKPRDNFSLSGYSGVILRFKHIDTGTFPLWFVTNGTIDRNIRQFVSPDSLPPEAKDKNYMTVIYGSGPDPSQ